jgi:hypothetical protein
MLTDAANHSNAYLSRARPSPEFVDGEGAGVDLDQRGESLQLEEVGGPETRMFARLLTSSSARQDTWRAACLRIDPFPIALFAAQTRQLDQDIADGMCRVRVRADLHSLRERGAQTCEGARKCLIGALLAWITHPSIPVLLHPACRRVRGVPGGDESRRARPPPPLQAHAALAMPRALACAKALRSHLSQVQNPCPRR